jgi:hypothetical protein
MPSMELMEMDPKQMLDLFEGHDLQRRGRT